MKVAILAGGTSTEREVSLSSGKCVAEALRRGRHEVAVFDPGAGWSIIDPALAPATVPRRCCTLPDREAQAALAGHDIVFSVLHGGQGEDGTISALLELLGVPYAGSRPGPSAAAMDKVTAKRLFGAVGVPTPEHLVLDRRERDQWRSSLEEGIEVLGLPLIIKPSDQGSTVGLTKTKTLEQAVEAAEKAGELSRQVLAERFIEGRELTVGVVAGSAMPVLEIVISSELYDFETKYHGKDNRYICPAELDAEIAARAQNLALRAFDALGLDDFARLDFMLDRSGGLWCLEANNLPGMTDHSLLPKEALVLGLDLTALLERILNNALSRTGAGKGR